jgi:hypothetical protein
MKYTGTYLVLSLGWHSTYLSPYCKKKQWPECLTSTLRGTNSISLLSINIQVYICIWQSSESPSKYNFILIVRKWWLILLRVQQLLENFDIQLSAHDSDTIIAPWSGSIPTVLLIQLYYVIRCSKYPLKFQSKTVYNTEKKYCRKILDVTASD